MVVPVLQVTLSLVIALFVLQVARHLLAKSQSGIATAFGDGLSWLLAA